MQKQIRNKIDELSNLGTGTDLLTPHIDLNANREITIEGCKGILEYKPDTVKINCGSLLLKIEGSELCLNNLSSGLFSVSGELISLEFSTV